MKNQIGFHVGLGGTKRGIGDWMASPSGKRSSLKSVDDYGVCLEALQKGVPTVIYRMTKSSGKVPTETPDYTLSPLNAAVQYTTMYLSKLPPEFDKVTWLELINEPRAKLNPGDQQYNDMHPVDWIGQFMLECAKLLVPQGYRICGPSFNSGEPLEEHYSSPGMLTYLSYCADHPQQAALALHEYNWGWREDWDAVVPHLWGRFQRWIAATDANGIPRDYKIFVSEWGGSHDWSPTWPASQVFLDKYNEIVALFPQVKAVNTWTMQSGWGTVDVQVNSWVKPITDGAYEKEFNSGNPPNPTFLGTTPDGGSSTERKIWDFGRANVCISPNADSALEKAMKEDGWAWSGPEKWTSIDGVNYAIQPADKVGENVPRVYYAEVMKWDNVMFLDGSDLDGDPLSGIHMYHPLLYRWRVTSVFDAQRSYANGKHEGIDLDIIGGQIDNTISVMPLYAGTVNRVLDSAGGYGKYVVLDHVYMGTPFQTWYAHMDELYVAKGQNVNPGDALGEIGTTGNVTGEHVHINLVIPNYGAPPSAGYVVNWVVDPRPYLPSSLELPLYDEESPTIDMSTYFYPKSGNFGDIVILKNNWGQGDERQQLQRDGIDSYLTKGQQYEKREIGPTRIWLLLDTSPGNGEYYTVSSPDGWVPTQWQVGDSFTRRETVTNYRKSNCELLRTNQWSTSIVLAALHKSWVSKGGIPFSDVVEVHWIVDGHIEEWYYYAPGCGLVAWRNRAGRESWANEFISVGDQTNNVREVINCL